MFRSCKKGTTMQEEQEKLIENAYHGTMGEILDIQEVLMYVLERKPGQKPYLRIQIANTANEFRTKNIKKMIEDYLAEFILPVGSVRYE